MKRGVSTEELEESLVRNFRDGVNVFLFTIGGEPVAPLDYGALDDILKEVTARAGGEEVGYFVVYRSNEAVNYASKTEYAGEPHLLFVRYSVAIMRRTILNMQLYLLIIGGAVFAVAVLVSFGFFPKS